MHCILCLVDLVEEITSPGWFICDSSLWASQLTLIDNFIWCSLSFISLWLMSSFPVYARSELNFTLPRLCPSFCVGLFWWYLLFSLSPVLFILSYLFSPELCLSSVIFSMLSSCFVCYCTFCLLNLISFPLTHHLIVSLCPLHLFRYSLFLLIHTPVPSFLCPPLDAALHCSSPLLPHLLSAVAGCCGCEEGRCSNSQMCESAESKAVSLTHSSLQVQDIAALCANVILLTNGIQSNFKKSYFSSSGLKYYRHH